MDNIATVIAFAVVIAILVIVCFIILKTLLTPKKIGSIQKLIKMGKVQQAQKVAKAILTKDSKDYVAHYWLGEAYMAENKTELAFMEFKCVAQHMVFDGSISEVAFRKQLAKLYVKYNENENALKEYLLLTKQDPKNPDNYLECGKLFEEANDQAAALGAFQKVIQLSPRNAKAHAALSNLYLHTKQYNDARAEIDTAIKLSPESPSNYYYLGKILKETHDYPGAVKAFEKGQRDPEFKQRALIEKGSCFMLAGQLDRATVEFENAIKSAKNEGSQETLYARYFLADCYEKNHKIEEALVQWTEISKKNPKFRDVPTKLNQYKDVQTNDSMKEYLTATPQGFLDIAKKAAKTGFNLVSMNIESTKYGCLMLATEESPESWKNARKQVWLVQFYRVSKPIEEAAVQKVADVLKEKKYYKAVIFSSSGFAIEAVNFAENRPIVLAGKEMVESILARAGL
ncbi:MAG: tetratricopeptide repeat protein [Treponema sp.]|nr:tetratricopeptide repeat protein [Treponema sp.]